MGCVVKALWSNTLYYLWEVPPDRDHLEREGLVIEQGVEMQIPTDIVEWPGPNDRPSQTTLGVCKTNPKRYRLFVYPEQLEPAGYEPTGLNYGGVYTPEKWERLVQMFPRMKKFYAIPDTDPPGAWEEAMRSIRGAR